MDLDAKHMSRALWKGWFYWIQQKVTSCLSTCHCTSPSNFLSGIIFEGFPCDFRFSGLTLVVHKLYFGLRFVAGVPWIRNENIHSWCLEGRDGDDEVWRLPVPFWSILETYRSPYHGLGHWMVGFWCFFYLLAIPPRKKIISISKDIGPLR